MNALALDRPLSALVPDPPVVPLVTGGAVPYLNLDHAASAAPLRSTITAVRDYLTSGQYSAIHRGAGWPSLWSTDLYELARDVARWFFNAPEDAAVVWTNNTTGAINTVVHAFGPATRVVVCAFEHHANLLPWTLCELTLLPVPPDRAALLESLETALAAGGVDLVAVTGASNVTGEIPPLAEIAALAHAHGARVLVDAAQLAPHHRIDMAALGVDWVVCSGHKLGAPFGVGVIVGDPLPIDRPPFIRGGAVVDYVLPDLTTAWLSHTEHRQEAGSPNVVGVLATVVAMATLAGELDRVADSERMLIDIGGQALTIVPGTECYRMWPSGPRIGVLTFNIKNFPYALLAAILSAEYGIGTRHGCFCAHPLVSHLHGVDLSAARQIEVARYSGGGLPGAVRVSFGLDSTLDSVLVLIEALLRIVKIGPQWPYRFNADRSECWPESDSRRRYRMSYEPWNAYSPRR